MVGRMIAAHDPDVVILSNVQLLALFFVARHLRRRRIRFILWHQDIHSTAIATAATKRLPRLGRLVAWSAQRVECAVATLE